MKTGIIVGASSGLGVSFVEAVVERYPQLDELWLFARRVEKLDELAAKYPSRKIRTFYLDVSQVAAYDVLTQLLEEEQPEVSLLISNAGYLYFGHFLDAPIEKSLQMVNTNINGTLIVLKAVLPYMANNGKVIHTNSVSSFGPMPNLALYSATKRGLLHFMEGLNAELKETNGVKITLVCPGNMDTAMLRDSGHYDDMRKASIGEMPLLDTNMVAVKALEAAEKGREIYTPHPFYKMYRVLGKLVPHQLLLLGNT